MIKKIAISIMILIVASCEKDNTAKIELSSDYLPLTVGNYWNFEVAGTSSVKGSQVFNGMEYFEIVDNFGRSAFYRSQNNKIYVREGSLDSKEEIKFDLTASKNDTWAYGPGNVALADRNSIVTIGENQIDSCLQFVFYNDNLIDYGFTIWLAPEIGFIQQTCQECYGSSQQTMKLLNAKINTRIIDFRNLNLRTYEEFDNL